MKVSPYLNYGGNCEQAFRFYEQNLGGKIVAMMKHGEQPGAKDAPESSLKGILYAHMMFGDTEGYGERCCAGTLPTDAQRLSLTCGR